ncbi:MAG: hypothetical protein ACC657_17120, partial [Thiohalomonadales bacterium]
MKMPTRVLDVRLLNVIVVVLIVLLSGCGGRSNSDTPGSQNSKLTSSTMAINVFEKASMTLAVSEQTFGFPGDNINIIAYTYEAESEIPVSDGSIEFSAEFKNDKDNTIIEFPIGIAPLVNGRADIAWTTSTDYFGEYTIKTKYLGENTIAPSEWQYSQFISRPNDKGAVIYSLARLNHIVNLLKNPADTNNVSTVASVFEDGLDRPLSDLLSQEFGLKLLEVYNRLEGGGGSFTVYNDLATNLSFDYKKIENNIIKTVDDLCVRTTFFIAANDDVLVLIIKGTDGEINTKVNNLGSPARITLGNKIAVHPGWAWMTGKLISGFAPEPGCNGQPSIYYPSFTGLNELINKHRINPITGKNRQLYVSGHSLGGALARMSMLALVENGVSKPGDKVFTFGAPWQGAYNEFNPLGLIVSDTSSLLDRFEPYANKVFNNNGLGLAVIEGANDPIPGLPDREARKGWDDSAPKLESILKYVQKACGVINKISKFFDAGEVCAEGPLSRLVGFDRPYIYNTISFISNSHYQRYIDGSIVIERDLNGTKTRSKL